MSEYKLRKYNEDMLWSSELEWMFRLMPDEVLLKLKDIIEFAISEKEYERSSISCGGMEWLIIRIEDELKIRNMEESGMTYKEANEKIISERKPKLEGEEVADE